MSDVVTVRLFAAARAAAGVTETTVAAGTVATVVDELTMRFPDLARVMPMCSLLVNGRQGRKDDAVPAGATVDVLPPFAGG